MKCKTRVTALLLLAALAGLSPAARVGVVNARTPGPEEETRAPGGLLSHGPAGAVNSSLAAASRNALEAYGKLPLAFVPNAGQTHPTVRYSAQTNGASFYFTQTDAVFVFQKRNSGQAGSLVLRLAFLGANSDTTVEGRAPGMGKVNYLVGKDATAWRTGLPTYEQVAYRDLWPGIDMVFRGDSTRIKYEFVLRPGAKVDDIQLEYQGAQRLSVDTAGQLLIQTSRGALEDARPTSYQDLGGRRVSIGSRYLLLPERGATAYGFAVGHYDATQPLVIDPGLLYSTYLGGSSTDIGNPIAVDGSGNAYITGETNSTNTSFPETPGAFDTTSNGQSDAFVAKLNAAGSALVYATYLGGNDEDIGFGIAVDGAGNAYITGETSSRSNNANPANNFPTTVGAFDTVKTDTNPDGFVTKLNATGSALVYSTYLGGINEDRGRSIAVDATGNAYITGETKSGGLTPFPTTLGAFDTSQGSASNFDAFVTKLNATGSALLYSTFLGATGRDQGYGIAIDALGNAHVTGVTTDAGFPTTMGAFDTSHNSGEDVFVAKLNPMGTAPLLYSTFVGGGNDDIGFGIAVDGAGNAYITGQTKSSNFPTTIAAFDTAQNQTDAFVTKLNPTGTAPLLYSTFLGGSSTDIAYAIAIDSAGNAYVTGETASTNFPTTAGAFDGSYNSNTDAFVSKLNPGLSGVASLVYSTYLGGGQLDTGFGIAVDSLNNAYVTGRTASTGMTNPFPTTPGSFDTSFNGATDAFVTKLDMIPSVPGCTTDSQCDDGNVCTTDSCMAGLCVRTNNTASCNDGNACTQSDTCVAGACVGTNPVVCGPSDQCHDAGTCDPATGMCSNPQKANGALCSDGNACTLTDTCQSGTCTGSTPVVCTALDQCHDAGTCNPASGLCSNPPKADGTTCNDANACTTSDSCVSGSCVGGPPPNCDDGNVCTDDSCNPVTGCVQVPNIATCDDGNACTTNDTCAASACVGGPPPNCDDGNVCTDDSCDPASGCVNSNNTAPCDDGNACTTNDTCAAGACGGGPPPNCDDGNVCTDDSCDPASGCVNSNNTAPCDDENACTTGDTCSSGICVGAIEVTCDDDNQCTVDTCDPAEGCQNIPEPDDTPCDDADLCTAGDTCQSGQCTGTAVGCKVTGGGQLTGGSSADIVSFGLNAQNTPTPKGQLEYHNQTKKTTYHSISIESLVITPIPSCSANPGVSGKRATIVGMIRRKKTGGEFSFTLRVEDCGEPGRNDFFDISIGDGEIRWGPLARGNIQVH